MEEYTQFTEFSPAPDEPARTRMERATLRARAQALIDLGYTQRGAALHLGIPHSTLQDWLAQEPQTGSGAEIFLSSPEGVEWLQRLVIAAHFVITLLSGGGVRRVCEFLALSGLDRFVASSYGTHQALNVALEEEVTRFAAQQQQRLSEKMPERSIAVCVDETFHPAICLVAIEPVSGYLLAERYAEDRSGASWSAALEEALSGLPLKGQLWA